MEACCKSNFWGFSFVVVCLFVCLVVCFLRGLSFTECLTAVQPATGSAHSLV